MYRPEYPNPQFRRENWTNLNGTWAFAFDIEDNGSDKKYAEQSDFKERIEVPFCPESSLSGLSHTDFINACWYARDLDIPADALKNRIFLHFGAVDYEATVYLNGKKVGTHRGGFVSFAMEITDAVHEGTNRLVVQARDNTRDPLIPSGKQSEKTFSHGCSYTRSTGIWQTVWLEYVPRDYIGNFRFFPDIENCAVTLETELIGKGTLTAEISYEGKTVCVLSGRTNGGHLTLTGTLSELHLWEVGAGRLYDVTLSFGEDRVYTYFGMREVRIEGRRILLNGRPVYQRLVLDQGLYPDGIYTAPNEEALIGDIRLSLQAGFNGARLHQKIFEPLFLYHADRMGYLVWGEFPCWGLDHTRFESYFPFEREWREEVARDFNHPSIVGWCPFNETWDLHGCVQKNEVIESAYTLTKIMDPTRPVIDTSGNFHVATDVYDLHNYKQDVALFTEIIRKLNDGVADDVNTKHPHPLSWDGKLPMFISEYGGIGWSDKDGWGYGIAPKSKEEFLERYRGLTDALLDSPMICAFCYTQLYDVEQEQNGLYTYERKPKFDMSLFREINTRKAKIEEE